MERSTAESFQLGRRCEFLRGIATVSIMYVADMQPHPELLENDPYRRYSVQRVVAELSGLLDQLERLELSRSLAAAEPLRPMLAEMQEALAGATEPQNITLRDPWANRLLTHVKELVQTVQAELAE